MFKFIFCSESLTLGWPLTISYQCPDKVTSMTSYLSYMAVASLVSTKRYFDLRPRFRTSIFKTDTGVALMSSVSFAKPCKLPTSPLLTFANRAQNSPNSSSPDPSSSISSIISFAFAKEWSISSARIISHNSSSSIYPLLSLSNSLNKSTISSNSSGVKSCVGIDQ